MIYAVTMKEYLSLDEVEKVSLPQTMGDEELLVLSLSKPSVFAQLVQKYEEPFCVKHRVLSETAKRQRMLCRKLLQKYTSML